MIVARAGLILVIAAAAAGCAREELLPGERVDLRDGLVTQVVDELPDTAPAFAVPGQVAHSAWTHTNGSPAHTIQHPAFGAAPVLAWSADIGQGDSRGNRIATTPVAANGRLYTLDSGAGVASVDGTTGAVLWTRDISPVTDAPFQASGGGLALSGATLFVTSGFGTLTALDASTGATRWEQTLGAAATGAPTVAGDIVYAVSRDGLGWAVDAATGRVRWQTAGAGDASGVTGPAGPAIGGSTVYFPFGAGDVVAAERAEGTRLWQASVSGGRAGRAYTGITDITGAVVADGARLYAGNATGRILALDAQTGDRLWTAREGATGPVWPAGGSVFAVTDAGSAVRLDAGTGATLWQTPLPTFTTERPRRRKAVVAHHGPVLAGGRLWIASSDGVLRGLDPATGAIAASVEIPGGAASAPIVVNRALYVLSKSGRLHAYR